MDREIKVAGENLFACLILCGHRFKQFLPELMKGFNTLHVFKENGHFRKTNLKNAASRL